jgi:23S rRNA (adenine2030-N6)-methyltransferase
MLSYRHAFHAGNHADVLKHVVLTEVLRYLLGKAKPLWYIDTHAGLGQYTLNPRPPAGQAEWLDGIARLWQSEDLPDALQPYLERVRALNPDGRLRQYPGSPRLAVDMLRPGDRAWLFELLGKDFQVLQAHFHGNRQVRCEEADGFDALKGLLPPGPRRGLVFIDPSYELKTDYQRLVRSLQDALQRFGTGCYVVWYPVVQRDEALALPARLQALPASSWLRAELRVKSPPVEGYGLYGSGMFVINPPWTLPTTLRELLPWLAGRLALDGQAAHALDFELR